MVAGQGWIAAVGSRGCRGKLESGIYNCNRDKLVGGGGSETRRQKGSDNNNYDVKIVSQTWNNQQEDDRKGSGASNGCRIRSKRTKPFNITRM